MADTWPFSGAQSGVALNADNANNVNLNDVAAQNLVSQVTCFFQLESADDNVAHLGVRISSIFVILIVSSAVTYFPVVATRVQTLKIPIWVYLFARYFGAGVIIATAFIHLLDPAYSEIGPQSCVGETGGWSSYSWPPAIALTSSMIIFLMDFYAERYVEKKYSLSHGSSDNSEPKGRLGAVDAAMMRYNMGNNNNNPNRRRSTHQHLHSSDQDNQDVSPASPSKALDNAKAEQCSLTESEEDALADRSFKQQISAFLILEFGVLFHSVIIGLTLATSDWEDFKTLYVVIIFHQSFEGMGIGARLSAIPFPRRLRWLPWVLCAGYGLTTPIAIAAGLGVRTTYDAGSYTANVVSGVLDSISAGILLYTGFVELLARDFLFNPDRTDDDKQLAFMLVSLFIGAGIMALLGKWA